MEPESYLDLAITEWLPRRWEDPARATALSTLARIFTEKHGDRWLADVLKAPRNEEATSGFHALMAAVKANRGDDSSAATAAQKAAAVLRKTGNSAAALFADQELVYALHRGNQPGECVKRALELEPAAARSGYAWIEGQTLLELGICRGMQGDAGGGYRDVTRGLARIRVAGYPMLELRGDGVLPGIQTNAGNLLAVWEQGREGLAKFWAGAYPANRAQQFYVAMRRASDALLFKETGYVFARAQALAISETPHREMEAIARMQLGALALETGREAEALEQIESAEHLFAALPPTKPAVENRLFAEIYRAESDMARGKQASARNRLQSLRAQAAAADSIRIRLLYHMTLGDALAAAGMTREAEAAHRIAVEVSEKRLASLPATEDRAAAVNSAAKAYRGLVAAQWERDTEHAQALKEWEWFRAAQLPGPRPLELDTRGLRRETIVSYAELPTGVVAWVFDDRGIAGVRLKPGKVELDKAVQRFLRLCSDPGSSEAVLRSAGRQLYDWLIAPVEAQLWPDRTLVIEPDTMVAAIPFGALVDTGGRYLGDRFSIVVSSGVADYLRRAARPGIGRDTRALVIANPALSGEMARSFPPLPHAEAESHSVAQRFPSTVVLMGTEATTDNLERQRPGVELLHFAGHGFSNAGNGGLLLAGNEESGLGAEVLDARRLAGQDWTKCRLAVLSACSAGTGEAEGAVNPESLVRRLLWSGVARVVASRWNVDSQSGAELMDRFYGGLVGGADVSTALRQAAARVRENSSTQHPYYWAGFQVFGSR